MVTRIHTWLLSTQWSLKYTETKIQAREFWVRVLCPTWGPESAWNNRQRTDPDVRFQTIFSYHFFSFTTHDAELNLSFKNYRQSKRCFNNILFSDFLANPPQSTALPGISANRQYPVISPGPWTLSLRLSPAFTKVECGDLQNYVGFTIQAGIYPDRQAYSSAFPRNGKDSKMGDFPRRTHSDAALLPFVESQYTR